MVARSDATFDTSFWIHASGVGLVPAVLRRYALHYAPAVATELPERFPSGREFWRLARAGEITPVAPRQDLVGRFGAGERAAISAALEHRDWVLLLDDRRAYMWAVARGLRALCTPLLVVERWREAEIDRAEALRLLIELERAKTLSPELLEVARSLMA